MTKRRYRAVLAMALTVVLAGVAPIPAAATGSAPAAPWTRTADMLGDAWQSSRDLAVTSTADAAGYHIFVEHGASAFAPQPLATLEPAGYDAATWTGYECLTGSGRSVVAVVAPADFTNVPELRDRGGYAYSVDVATGAVHPLIAGVAIKYYSPGCGPGDTAVLTRNTGSDQAGTQLITVDAARGTVITTTTVPGQFTSAVPGPAGTVLAARGPHLVQISATGTVRPRATVSGQIFDIVADGSGTATFLAAHGSTADVDRLGNRDHTAAHLATTDLSSTKLYAGRNGTATLVTHSVTGPTGQLRTITTRTPSAAGVDGVSLDGQIVLGHGGPATDRHATWAVATRTGRDVPAAGSLPDPTAPTTALPMTGFALTGTTPAPLAQVAPQDGTEPVTPGQGCAVPRNNPTLQAPQPGRAQVERAVDLAVTGNLTDQRPVNYLQMGLVAYFPSSDFPPHALTGGGSVPAQVFLGILAQESNMEQASWHALPGIAGNPLIADYYGSGGTVDTINYAGADCGYGISQVTTGMKYGETDVYSLHGQMKIATDYEENIAAGLQILEDKWNQLAANGVTANDGGSQYIENWYTAVWAYNTGWHNATPPYTVHGLGWANNPINPDYPPNRAEFLSTSYADASHPGDWPYQERVFGWIDHPQLDLQGNPSYAAPTRTGGATHQSLVLPSRTTFCDSSDNCDPANAAPCGYSLLAPTDPLYYACWWHQPVNWIPTCANTCSVQTVTYAIGAADPGVTDPHPAECTSTLPATAVIVDDLTTPTQNVEGCGTGNMNWATGGHFALAYGADASGTPVSVIDTHQLGAGFGGHIFFTHNRAASDTAHHVTGTWTANLPTHLYNVFAHMPSTGATTNSADYKITAADGSVNDSVVSQHTSQDEWTSLGYFNLSGNAAVSLNNVTNDASLGTHDVAFDAIGFVPVSGTFVHHTFDAVSVFSENQDINTPLGELPTPVRSMSTLYNWAMERTAGGPAWSWDGSSANGLLSYPSCGGSAPTASCVGPATLAAAQAWEQQVQAAGTSPTNHPPGQSEATWMALANPTPNPATSPDQAFASDESYKIKTHVAVSWALDNSGNPIPGSQASSITTRTGTTEIPPFVLNFVRATVSDYGPVGVTMPNIGYNEVDANEYTGDPTPVANPLVTGLAPGRAYMPHATPTTIVGQCVQTKSTSGGTIGYRPLDAQGSTDAAMGAWVTQINAAYQAGHLPVDVYTTAGDIYSLFFKGTSTIDPTQGSLFNNAPPIWQNVGVAFCANGPLPYQWDKDAGGSGSTTFVAQSYMPDLYLYYDGHEITANGAPGTGPVQLGDFQDFSNFPGLGNINGNQYGLCNLTNRGRGGNPWSISIPPLSHPDDRPNQVTDCDTGTTYSDTYGGNGLFPPNPM